MEQHPTVWVLDDDRAAVALAFLALESAAWKLESARSAEEFLRRHDPASPGCLVLELRLPRSDGLQLQRTLASRGTEASLIFLSGFGNVSSCARAMKSGAVDFLEKPVNGLVLLETVQRAVAADILRRRACSRRDGIVDDWKTLTPREAEVLRSVVGGCSNRETASSLGIAVATVKVHRGHMMEKMRARSVAELVRRTETIAGSATSKASELTGRI